MIGKVIKVFAIIILVICLAGSVISGISMMDYDEESGIIIVLAGAVASVFSFSMLYGYGTLIETNASIDKKLDTLLIVSKQNSMPPRATQQPPVSMVYPPAPAAPAPVVNEPVFTPSSAFATAPAYTPEPKAAPQPETVSEPVAETPSVSTDATVTGWTCSVCGAKYAVPTAFCRSCGSKRV